MMPFDPNNPNMQQAPAVPLQLFPPYLPPEPAQQPQANIAAPEPQAPYVPIAPPEPKVPYANPKSSAQSLSNLNALSGQVPVDKKKQAEADAAIANQNKVLDEQQRQAAADNDKIYNAQVATQLADAHAQAALAENQNKAALMTQDYLAKKDAAQKAYDKMEVDPNRKFSGWNGVLAAIAMGLGQYASTMTGSRNTAMDLINSAIDKDIALQQDKIAKAKGKIGDMDSAYKFMRDQLKDDNAAALATRQMAYDNINQTLNNIQATSKNREVITNIENLKVQVAQQSLNTANQLAQYVHGNIMSAESSRASILAQKENNQNTINASFMEKLVDAQKKGDPLAVPGLGRASNEAFAKEAVALKNAADPMLSAIDEVIKLRGEKGGTETFDNQRFERLQALRQIIIDQMPAFKNSGVLNPSEFERFEKEWVDPSAYNVRGAFGQADKVTTKYKSRFITTRSLVDRRMKNYGLPGYRLPDEVTDYNAIEQNVKASDDKTDRIRQGMPSKSSNPEDNKHQKSGAW